MSSLARQCGALCATLLALPPRVKCQAVLPKKVLQGELPSVQIAHGEARHGLSNALVDNGKARVGIDQRSAAQTVAFHHEALALISTLAFEQRACSVCEPCLKPTFLHVEDLKLVKKDGGMKWATLCPR